MTQSQSIISQDTPVFSGLKIDIGFAQQVKISDPSKQEIRWDETKYQLQSASLKIDASQTYDSGADLTVIVNNEHHIQDKDTMRWGAFDSGDHALVVNIIGELINGENNFQLQYHLANGAITGQECVASATLFMTFLGVATGEQPAKYSSPGGPSRWANFLKSGSIYLKIGAAIMLFGVGLALVLKFSAVGRAANIFNKFRR